MTVADPGKVPKRDRLQEVADLIVSRLEAGEAEGWKRPWLSLEGARNGTSGRPYQGINALILGTDPRVIRSGDPRFYTFGQVLALEKDRQETAPNAPRIALKKGSKGEHVLAWKPVQLREAGPRRVGDEAEGKVALRLVDAHVVFHASDIDGLPSFERKEGKDWDAHAEADAILGASGVIIRHQGDRAYFSSRTGNITLPPRASFQAPEDYYGTAFHELAHARFEPVMELTRGKVRFGSEAYAQEEVRVELAAAMVCDGLGLVRDGHRQSTAYIGSWLKAVREDKHEVFRAATDAKRLASDILLMSTNAQIRALGGERAPEGAVAGAGEGRGARGTSPAPTSHMPSTRGSTPGWEPDVDLREHQDAQPAPDGTRRWISIGRDRAGGVTLIETGGYAGGELRVLARAPHDEPGRWRLDPTPYRDRAGEVVGWRGGKVVSLEQGLAALADWARGLAEEAMRPPSRLAAAFSKAVSDSTERGPAAVLPIQSPSAPPRLHP